MHDGVETVVIDEDLIKAAYEEERSYEKKHDSAELKREPLVMQEIMQEARTLRLSFKSRLDLSRVLSAPPPFNATCAAGHCRYF
jgi:hypothetical protein